MLRQVWAVKHLRTTIVQNFSAYTVEETETNPNCFYEKKKTDQTLDLWT